MLTPSYFGITVTLPTAGTAYSLLVLLQAVDSKAPGSCRDLSIQVHSSSPGNIAVGDASLGASRRGASMSVGESRTYTSAGSGVRGVAVGDKLVMGDANNSLLNVEVLM
jgi:hypothetical protein